MNRQRRTCPLYWECHPCGSPKVRLSQVAETASSACLCSISVVLVPRQGKWLVYERCTSAIQAIFSETSKQTAGKEQMAGKIMRVHCSPAELKRPPCLLPQTSPGPRGPDTATCHRKTLHPVFGKKSVWSRVCHFFCEVPSPPTPHLVTLQPVPSFLVKLPL